jgi:hypothetical protein
MARPEQRNEPPKLVGARKKVAEVRGFIPDRHLDTLKNNDKLLACCRDAEAHDVELFKTHDDAPGADLMILHCACGRRHIRFAAGAGKP